MITTAWDEQSQPILTTDFIYPCDEAEETEDTEEKQTLSRILIFLSGDGTKESFEQQALLFLNLIFKIQLQPSFRLPLSDYVAPAWTQTFLAQRIAKILLARYRKTLRVRVAILLYNVAPYLISDKNPESQEELAEWLGITPGAVSQAQAYYLSNLS